MSVRDSECDIVESKFFCFSAHTESKTSSVDPETSEWAERISHGEKNLQQQKKDTKEWKHTLKEEL